MLPLRMRRVLFIPLVVFGYYLWYNQQALKEFQRNVQKARNWANEKGNLVEPWLLVLITTVIVVVVIKLHSFLYGPSQYGRWTRIKRAFFRITRKIPFIGGSIQKKLRKAMADVEKSGYMIKPDEPCNTTLPKKGWDHQRILKELNKYDDVLGGANWESGFVSGAVYNGSPEITDLSTDVYKRYAWTNPLHGDLFPQIKKMEAEVVAMGVKIFNGGKDACGTMTSGGTESILMAMKAYREIAIERGIEMPEILAPSTAHCAFDKAADYFRMKLVRVPVSGKSFSCAGRTMHRYVTSNTIVLIGSVPQFPHGAIDPIEEFAKVAQYHAIFLHVDCCLGGFIAPFAEKAGFNIPPFDFRVKGVSSISADTHKYGFAPKGSSLIMYSSRQLRIKQFFAATEWPGGVYASPTMAGSRSGAIIATTWATMMNFGEEGYIESTRKIISTTQKIENGLRNIPGLYVMGKPQLSVVAVSSKDFSVYRLASEMKKKGWHLNYLQKPAGIHLAVTMRHTQEGVAEKFVTDARQSVEAIKKEPEGPLEGEGAFYGISQNIPDKSIVSDMALSFIELFYKAEKESLFF
ncbi:sphingosine-1-phosphate lyase 1-like [Dysidea avara]|uniref:sphingosine-1-phosphate lyase 1-like n=1 Tax=Dysidea avara TaxID=196820 RepID=UPI003321BA33